MNQQGNNLLIYVVDDEALLLDLAESSLRPGKYEIKKFVEPARALQSFLNESHPPALLISDYAMGEMDGLQLIQNCKKIQPQLKTMLVSGTAGEDILDGAPVKVDRFLAKPYIPSVFAGIVEELLSS